MIDPQTRERLYVVYFVQCGDVLGPVKIGRASDPRWRLHNLQTGNPITLRLVAFTKWMTLPDAKRRENKLHARFSEYKIRGEWFQANWTLHDLMLEIGDQGTGIAMAKQPRSARPHPRMVLP